MESWSRIRIFVLIIWSLIVMTDAQDKVPFDANYNITWGNDHLHVLNNGMEVELTMDNNSGCGFASKQFYGSGFFHMRMKLPNKNTAGVVSTFYLITAEKDTHEELDFEFLGDVEGKPITLQTNVFANGVGDREQRINLWFDPSADFHYYKILWNPNQIVFYVDETPIRVYKNISGIPYPTRPMQVQCTLWDGDSWATDGGKTKIDWTNSPFVLSFEEFKLDACPVPADCHAASFWWNDLKYYQLQVSEKKLYENVRSKYMNYDYCTDHVRSANPPPECQTNIAEA